jgi:hypothetical protein
MGWSRVLGWMAACLLWFPGLAWAAAPTTLGGLDPTPNDGASDCTYTQGIYVEAQSASSGSPASPYLSSNDLVPVGGGTITSWSVSDQLGGAQLRLAVVTFAPGASSVTVHAFSPVETIPGNQNYSGVVTFPVNIPVTPGEQIGLDVTNPPVYHGCVFAGPSDEQVDVADDGYEGTFAFGRYSYFPNSQLSLEAALEPSNVGAGTGSSPPTKPQPNHGRLHLGRILQRSVRGGRLELLVPITSPTLGRVSATLRLPGNHVSVARRTTSIPHPRATVTIVLSSKLLAALRRRHHTRLRLTVTGPRGSSLSRWVTLR